MGEIVLQEGKGGEIWDWGEFLTFEKVYICDIVNDPI